MARLILLILLGLSAAVYFPDSRQMLADILDPVIAPINRWSTKDEMRRVARDVVAYEQSHGQIPNRTGWVEWLEWRYVVDETWKDPWGSAYELVVLADSLGIMSYGPDRTKETEDDFTIMAQRRRPGRYR